METGAEHEERTDDPAELTVVFEGVAPKGVFVTAFYDHNAGLRYVEARQKRFACYWRKYRLVAATAAGDPAGIRAKDQ